MIKTLFPLLNLLMAIILQVLPGGISVKMDVPGQVNAGSEFEVRITLDKGDLESFSRFQQAIPLGLTAISGTSANADFTFEENRVRLIWLKMPADEELTFTYRVKVDERLKGTFDLTGQFSYIEDNERKVVDISPVVITIVPSPTVDPSLIVDISEFDKKAVPYVQPFEGIADNIACIRQEPVPDNDGTYIVHLLVNKNDMKQFAKIEEAIPAGYTASSIDPKQAIFTFTNQTAKFLWMNMPTDAYFTVSYKLIPRNQSVLPAPDINGKFSYMANEKTLSVDIIEKQSDLLALGRDEVYNLITSALSEPTQGAVASQEIMANTPPVDLNNEQPSNTEVPFVPVQDLQQPETRSLDIENGIYYRIQVAAGHQPVNINRYFSRLKIELEVRSEEHDGWRKYSVGSFAEYREARDYRIHIWNTTPVKDAFVTAYNDGTRITVQEALMITDQKWYQ